MKSPPRVRTNHDRGRTGLPNSWVTTRFRHKTPWASTEGGAVGALDKGGGAGGGSSADRKPRAKWLGDGGVTGEPAGSALGASSNAAPWRSKAGPLLADA